MFRMTGLTLVIGASVALTAPVTAADKPDGFGNRPITVIVCYGKGSGSDRATVALTDAAEPLMRVRINTVNNPGGGGLNCIPEFMQAPADGYTIMQNSDPVASKHVLGQLEYHPYEDMRPILINRVSPTGYFVRADDERFLENGEPSWDKLVAHAQENDLTLSNIPVEMEQATNAVVSDHFGIQFREVPFNRTSERVAAVIGGQLDILMEQPGDVGQFVEAGDLVPILAVWPERWDIYPETPATGADFGMDWDPLLRFSGLFVKNDVPEDVFRSSRHPSRQPTIPMITRLTWPRTVSTSWTATDQQTML